MLIVNYGLFWRTEDVFWGRPKKEGKLLGECVGDKGFGKIDFREQSGLYALYADFDLLYVGQAGGGGQKLFDRLKQHSIGPMAGRWNMFSWFGTREVLVTGKLKAEKKASHPVHQEVLDHLEAVLIYVAEPRLNRQGGKWGKEVEQYLQLRDERLGKNVEQMVRELHSNGIKGGKPLA